MLVVKDQKMSFYKEYDIIKNEIVELWLANVPARDDMNDPIALYELASQIYGQMYHTDNILICKAEDVKKEYNELVDLLKELKEYSVDTGELEICITCLENCLKQIPVITRTQFLTEAAYSNPLNEGEEQSAFSLIIAECSFKMLNEIFSEMLGESP